MEVTAKRYFFFAGQQVPMIVPMICFCDIRLETITRFSNYGRYGIGLTKEWGIKNKLNPVFYLEKNSTLADSLVSTMYRSLPSVLSNQLKINGLIQNIAVLKKLGPTISPMQAWDLKKFTLELQALGDEASALEHFIYSLYYTKHYESDLVRENRTIKNYRFYDEREWRYMPQFKCAVCELRRTEEEYQKWRATSEKKPVLKDISLGFDFSDIMHIIVEKESEVKEIIALIKDLEGSRCDPQWKDLMLTKITSFEKIENDY